MIYLHIMTEKVQTETQTEQQTSTENKEIIFNEEDGLQLAESLKDYKWMVEYAYKHNLMFITQWEKMLREETDKEKTIELVKGLNQYKKNAEMLDLARMRADQLLQKVTLVIWELPDEVIDLEWSWQVQDDNTTDEQQSEVSEDAEVLHSEGQTDTDVLTDEPSVEKTDSTEADA